MRTILNGLRDRLRTRELPSNWVLERNIPAPEINYNQGVIPATKQQYIREYKENACLREFPFLIRTAKLSPESCILDYGCGPGRFAYAASKFLNEKGAYYGYEPNQTALSFLKSAYSNQSNFAFSGTELPFDQDYVAIEYGQRRSSGSTAGTVDLSALVKRPLDGQWSCSVFTHMWRDDIVAVLKNMSQFMAKDGVCINTWLCVDDHAAYTLRCGLADRALPYRVNGILTYSESNPLLCSAYELSDMKEIYARGGHKIEEILWGSWAGGRDNGILSQDVVVSRPMT